MTYETIVLGAGHNGLVAAARLARQGKRVLLLEKRVSPGGLCAPREFHPGYTVPGILHEATCLSPTVAGQLELAKHGLEFRGDARAILALSGGKSLLLGHDLIRGLDGRPVEEKGCRAWSDLLARVRPFVLGLIENPPPALDFSDTSNLIELGLKGLGLRRLGRKWMLELMRIAPMSAADWLSEYFGSPFVIEALSFPGVCGSWVGPRAAGTAANLLIAECCRGLPVKGGPAALAAALEKACRAAGVEIRTESKVAHLQIRDGRISGIRLEDGQILEGRIALAAMDPRKVFLELIHPRNLSLKTERQFLSLRARGVAAKVHLALSALPGLASGPEFKPEQLRLGGGHPDFLEKAFDAVKYGRFSPEPHLDLTIPSLSDPSLAPAGHHVLSALVHCAPYDLKEGWSGQARHDLERVVLDRLEDTFPGIRKSIVASEVLTPLDLETEYGCSGGHLFHGELALDQLLFMRPTPETSGYRTPIQGLYLAGSGCHPGGGMTGLPGWLGAGAALKG